jgi:flagellar hook-length control protein FliK
MLIQVDGGRMPQAGGAVEQQTVHGADKTLASATEGSAEVPARAVTLDKKPQDVVLNAVGMQPPPMLTQVDGGRMPQAGGLVVQQSVAASVADAAVTSLSNNGGSLGIVVATNAAAGGGLNPPESLLNPSRSAMAANGHLQGASTDSTALFVVPKGNEPQHTSQKEPDSTALSTLTLPSRLVSAIVEQQNPAVVSSTLSTERGTAPSKLNGSVSGAAAPVSGLPGPGNGVAEVRTTGQTQDVPSAQKTPVAEIPAAEQTGREAVTPERGTAPSNQSGSVSGTVAPVSGLPGPGNGGAEVRTTGQARDVLSAQNTPVAEIPAASTAMTVQTEPQQDAGPVKSGVMPVQVAPSPASSQQPDQAVTANNHTLEGTMPVQVAFVPAAGKMGVEAGVEAVQTRPESAATAKPVQSITVEAVKLAEAGSSGGELSTGDDKGTAGNFMNGQFHATLMHQQGNADGASATGAVPVPVQNNTQQSGLPEQIMQQVKDSLVNHEVKAGNDQIVLRLSPENLGELKVNLTMDGQSLKVQIVAENHMVRDALLQNTDSLKESLARQNIRMESFDVTTGGRGAGNPGQGQQQNDWREFAQQKQQSAWMSSGGYRLPDTTTAPGQLAYQTPSQHTMVDLHF